MKKKYSEKIGDIFHVPLQNGTFGILQRAFTDINRLGYDIVILYNIILISETDSITCDRLNTHLIKTSAYTNTVSGIKDRGWKIIKNCNLPPQYKLPLFKEYCGPPYEYDGTNKWNIYDPLSGNYRPPIDDAELEGLVTHIGFTPVDIENWLQNGSHGLKHEMFN